jgi:predicted permease
MRDFQAFVRAQVAGLGLPPEREDKIVEEWAAALEDAYDGLRAEGATDAEAWTNLQAQVPDWRVLGQDLLESEPVLARLASPQRFPFSGAGKQRLIASLRTGLTSGLGGDLRHALRLFVAERGFSATVVLTLAICLGANAAIFSVVHAVLLRPMPVPAAERIVGMGDVYPTVTPNDILANDVPSFFDRREALTTLDEQAMFTFWFDTINFDGVAEEVRAMRVTPSLFRLLGVPPALGRTFTDEEGEVGADRRIILSHGLWQRLHGGDPAVIGRELRLGWTGEPYTIVGVMPAGFSFFDRGYDGHARAPGQNVQFWIPLAFTATQKSDAGRTRYGYFHVGRLRPDATIEQLQAELDALLARNKERFPQFRYDELGMYTIATPLQDALTRDVRGYLYLLWAAAGVVLLIGAINIMNLSLARTGRRTRELATRLALGARRVQVTRQLIFEGLVPASAGGVAGIVVGSAILRVLASTGLEHLPNAGHVQMDPVVILVIGTASLLVGTLMGLVPSIAAGSVIRSHPLADSSRSKTDGRAATLFRRGLVVTQIALSVVLLIGAALLLSSFRHLLRLDTGVTATRVTTATIFPPPSRYPDAASVVDLSNRLLDGVRAIPGVEAAGMTTNIALSGFASPATVVAAERRNETDGAPLVPSIVGVTPGYFATMGTPIVGGRDFEDSDTASSARVAIVDESLAARLWPDADPIGRVIFRGDAGPYTVVGVVRDVRFEGLAARAESIGAAYFPHGQGPGLSRLRWLAVRTTNDAPIAREVRAVLARIDPDLPLADVQTMTERTVRSLVPQSLAMGLATLFGVVALFLSVLGIYGVLAYVVARRTREIGIRMALGGTVGSIFQLVFREGLTLVAAGLLVGLAGALMSGQTLQGQLVGVQSTDPIVLGTVTLLTGVIGLSACVAPAMRAARVQPVDVLTEG